MCLHGRGQIRSPARSDTPNVVAVKTAPNRANTLQVGLSDGTAMNTSRKYRCRLGRTHTALRFGI